jgi:hypothetical protein
MRLISSIMALLFSLHLPGQASAQSYQISPYGFPLNCTSNNGAQVAFYMTDQAMSTGGGFATYQNGWPVIYLSPTVLSSLPQRAALFLIFHECAHHALPLGVGLGSSTQETNADCFAAQQMVSFGIISNAQEFQQAMAQLAQLPATASGHPPGQFRVNNAANCAGIWF